MNMRSTLPILVSLILCLSCGAQAASLRVAVAANFAATAKLIADDFESTTGTPVALSVASTGVLVTQILHGAPFDIFLAADSEGPALLAARGKALGESQVCYALGKLVLLGATLDSIGGNDARIAIANPATAPYGRAAQEVLSRDSQSPASRQHLLRGSNVLQAYQFWIAGGADQALVAASLAGDEGVPVPADWHSPIEQHAIMVSERHPAAGAFMTFLSASSAAATITDAGYRECS